MGPVNCAEGGGGGPVLPDLSPYGISLDYQSSSPGTLETCCLLSLRRNALGALLGMFITFKFSVDKQKNKIVPLPVYQAGSV